MLILIVFHDPKIMLKIVPGMLRMNNLEYLRSKLGLAIISRVRQNSHFPKNCRPGTKEILQRLLLRPRPAFIVCFVARNRSIQAVGTAGAYCWPHNDDTLCASILQLALVGVDRLWPCQEWVFLSKVVKGAQVSRKRYGAWCLPYGATSFSFQSWNR